MIDVDCSPRLPVAPPFFSVANKVSTWLAVSVVAIESDTRGGSEDADKGSDSENKSNDAESGDDVE